MSILTDGLLKELETAAIDAGLSDDTVCHVWAIREAARRLRMYEDALEKIAESTRGQEAGLVAYETLNAL